MPIRDAGTTDSNAVRWQPDDRRGHVESFFVKANAPGEGRAIWLRFTLLAPRALPEAARAEAWAMAFDRRAGAPRAWKATTPAGAAVIAPEQLGFALPGCELEPGGLFLRKTESVHVSGSTPTLDNAGTSRSR